MPEDDHLHATSGEPEGGWRVHFSTEDVDVRRMKAAKIISLIGPGTLSGAKVLEIGTGTGVITAELARAAGPDGEAHSIDTMDTRVDHEGYAFQLTSGVTLPFPDDTFDVIVTNHVIEHVGGRAEQLVHLREIARVLKPGGTGYMATPSRWAPIEPHFHIPMLSWPPRRWRDRYVRLARKGKVYDVDPFGPRELAKAITTAGLTGRNVTVDAITEVGRIEAPRGAKKLLTNAPAPVKRAIRPLMPTMIFLVQPA